MQRKLEIKRIAKTIHARGEDALAANDIKQAAIERVFGFEILPAPFVVAHLQLGLTLQNLGAPFSQTRGERASVYLTNALTGWDASTQQPPLPNFPELSVERDAAGAVKQKKPILVILGNPPYNAFAGVSPQEENGLVEDYKVGLIKEWGIKKFNLDDLYVRFFRLAERRIAEQTGKGVVCYISNFSYLRDPSFVVMRQRFLSEFDSLWFDNLNGDSRETNKRTPDGKSDPSIFSTKYNCEGIRKGTAISLLVRKDERAIQPVVRFRQFWGVTKRADLLNSIEVEDFDAQYELAQPDKSNRLSFVPSNVAQHYLSWPKLVDLCAQPPSPGLLEGRKGALIAFDKGELARRMQIYYDSALDWSTFKTMNTGLATNGARFAAKEARVKVLAAESYNPDHLIRYVLRPFDTRWSYFSAVRPLWNEPRPDLWAQYWPGNNFLVTRMKTEKEAKGSPVYFSSCLADYQSLARNASVIPIRLRRSFKAKAVSAQTLLFDDVPTTANLSEAARTYLSSLGILNPDDDIEAAELLWMHALAITYAPAYLMENAEGIRGDWPRVPLPSSKEALRSSAELGRQVALLLDTEVHAQGVTGGAIRADLRVMALISRNDDSAINFDTGDLAVTAGWGSGSQGKAIMPGSGKVIVRAYTTQERVAIEEAAATLSITSEQAIEILGLNTYDIYLNDITYWRNIPEEVWKYTIGGYQVIKKWLSYREYGLIERALTSALPLQFLGGIEAWRSIWYQEGAQTAL